tara:strand:- start:27935 stop:29302 length:1368 start_codon:yes stop_codon:yes gene_type:complete
VSLESFFKILRARWLLIAGLTVFCLVATLVVSMSLPKTYTATTELIVDGKPQDLLSGQVLPARAGYIATQVDVIQSRKVASKVYELLPPDMRKLADQRAADDASDGEVDPEKWVVQTLRRNMVATPGRNSNVLSVSVSEENSELAAGLANAVSEAYVRTNLELRTDPARRFSQWYDEQMTVLRDNLREARTRLTDYQQSHGIVAADQKLDVETSKLRELSSMLVAAQGDRLQDDVRQVQDKQASAQVLGNPVVQKLRSDLAQAEATLSDASTRYGRNHPEYKKAEAEVQSLKSQLSQETRVVGSSLQSTAAQSAKRESELRDAVAEQKEKVLKLNAQRDELDLLKQEVDAAQEAYNTASGRASASRLESRLSQTDVAVLNDAVAPTLPSAPDVRLNLVIAAALGIMLGIGLSLLLELTHRRVRSRAEVEEYLGVPVLAYLPSDRRRWFGKERSPV